MNFEARNIILPFFVLSGPIFLQVNRAAFSISEKVAAAWEMLVTSAISARVSELALRSFELLGKLQDILGEKYHPHTGNFRGNYGI